MKNKLHTSTQLQSSAPQIRSNKFYTYYIKDGLIHKKPTALGRIAEEFQDKGIDVEFHDGYKVSSFSLSLLTSGSKSYEKLLKIVSGLTAKRRKALDVLITQFIKHRYVFIGQGTVAEKIGATRKTVNVAFGLFHKMGLIKKVTRFYETCLYGINLGFMNLKTLNRLSHLLKKSASLLPMLMAKKVSHQRGNSVTCVNNSSKSLENKTTHYNSIKELKGYIYSKESKKLDIQRVSECVSEARRSGYMTCWMKNGVCINPVHINPLKGDMNPDVYNHFGGVLAFTNMKLLSRDIRGSLSLLFGGIPDTVSATLAQFDDEALKYAVKLLKARLNESLSRNGIGHIKDHLKYFISVVYNYSIKNKLYIHPRLMLLALSTVSVANLELLGMGFNDIMASDSKAGVNARSGMKSSNTGVVYSRRESLNAKMKDNRTDIVKGDTIKGEVVDKSSSAYSSSCTSGERPCVQLQERKEETPHGKKNMIYRSFEDNQEMFEQGREKLRQRTAKIKAEKENAQQKEIDKREKNRIGFKKALENDPKLAELWNKLKYK